MVLRVVELNTIFIWILNFLSDTLCKLDCTASHFPPSLPSSVVLIMKINLLFIETQTRKCYTFWHRACVQMYCTCMYANWIANMQYTEANPPAPEIWQCCIKLIKDSEKHITMISCLLKFVWLVYSLWTFCSFTVCSRRKWMSVQRFPCNAQ
jgi:hypothetical protein